MFLQKNGKNKLWVYIYILCILQVFSMYIIKSCCCCLFAFAAGVCLLFCITTALIYTCFPVHYQPCMHLMEMDGFLCRQHHTNVALACWIIEAVIACLPVLLISWWQVHQNQRNWSIVSLIYSKKKELINPQACCKHCCLWQ